MNHRAASIFFAFPVLLGATSAQAQKPAVHVAQQDPPQAPPGASGAAATAAPLPADEAKPPVLTEPPPPSTGASPAAASGPLPTSDLLPFLSKFKTSIIGFVEVDAIHDSTQSYQDGASNAPLARSSTYAGQHGRFQFTSRNTQLGVKLEAPEFSGIKASTICKGDFFGNQPGNPQSAGVTENNFLSSPTFRMLHCYFKAETEYVDVLAGLTYYLFGQQNSFFPTSVAFLEHRSVRFLRSFPTLAREDRQRRWPMIFSRHDRAAMESDRSAEQA